MKATNTCITCGAKAGEAGAMAIDGRWHSESDIDSMNSSQGATLYGEYPRCVKTRLRSGYCQICWPLAFPKKAEQSQRNADEAKRKAALEKLVRNADLVGQTMMEL